jgi:hypothetical protein
MLLKTKDGIACDLCGSISKENFVYYSFEGTPVSVDTAACIVAQQPKDLDIDVCEKCYTEAEQIVRKNLAPAVVRGTVKCDLCTKVMSGKFQYHIVIIHKVYVDKEQAKEGPFKVDMKFMDFNLDDSCFTSMANTVLAVRQKVKSQGDWS